MDFKRMKQIAESEIWDGFIRQFHDGADESI